MTVSAFTDDALGDHDAVALAELIRTKQVSPEELVEAARARVAAVDGELHGLQVPLFDRPRRTPDRTAPLWGVPTFLKDNTDLAGVPTNHGSEAFTAPPAKDDGAYTKQFLSTGLAIVGKTRMPEFGFNATTEYMTEKPVRNPWETGHSIGASSGGSAAFVAAGVVPIAHANDGGGSIRIPAAAGGLVGLKPTRGRHVDGEQARHLPINMISEGVVTRTVRDSAAFLAACEDHWRNPHLPPVGLVRGPADRRLRIGVVLDTVTGALVDDDTRAAVEATAAMLEKAGHVVEPMQMPITRQFADDFVQYWALLADLSTSLGKLLYDRGFDAKRTDGLTKGLRNFHRHHVQRTIPAIRRLKRAPKIYAEAFEKRELILSPTLARSTPELGWISPRVPYDELMDRLQQYVTYTPINNIAGTPAITLPTGRTTDGLPVGVMLSAAHGDERTLLEVAFGIEAEHPFPRIQD